MRVTTFAASLLAAAGTLAMAESASNTQPSRADRQFIVKAAQGGMMEVKLGELAQQKAANPAVKQFGQRMVQDHSKANEQLMQLVQKKNAAAPQGIGAKNQKMVDSLSKLEGAAFDRAYMAHMVKDHNEDIALFNREAQRGRDSDLKTFAGQTVPTLKEHLQLARTTAQQVGATTMQHGAM